jgi:hypothetical protein
LERRQRPTAIDGERAISGPILRGQVTTDREPNRVESGT